MKKLLLSAAVAFATMTAQAQDLPKPSPSGEVEQTVGVTEIEIDYSRPGVKDRTIFGGLLSFGELWRFGANAATLFKTEDDLYFSEGVLKGGEYAVLAIPGKESWELIFNTDLDVSEQTYNKDKDALRVKVKPQENSFTETLTLGIDDIRHESASFVMLWENTKVSAPFKVMTDELAVRNIKKAIEEGEDLGEVYQSAANYYYGSLEDYKTADDYIDKSIELGQNYGNLFLKARILKANGEDEKAIELARKSLELAEKTASKGYIGFIAGTLKSWEK